ncbi:hypothetical protein Hanom_Chr10g00891611 [Helianthus anomalus]
MLKALVVGINSAFSTVHVMPPYFERKHYGSQLQVVRRIILLVNLQLSRSISYQIVALHQHTSKTLNRSVTIDHKIFCTIWWGQNRCTAEFLFQQLESILLFRSPRIHNTFLCQRGKRLRDLREILDKFAIIPSETKKLSHFRRSLWCRPILDNFNLSWIHVYS